METKQSPHTIRAALIGLGKMGLVHAATIFTHPRVTVTAFCENSKFMVQSLKTFFPDVHFYDDYRKMLDKEPLDVVYIATPTGSHAKIASHCAAAGKHLFVEKPLATNIDEANQVAKDVAASGVRNQVGYVCRYIPTFERAKGIMQSGALGRTLGFGIMKYSSDVVRKVEKGWRFARKSSEGGGGVVNEFACHAVDLIVWMFGEPKRVSSRMESWYSSDVEDYVHAILTYENFSGWIDSSWSMQDYRKPYTRIEVTGDNGRLIVTDTELRWLVNRSHGDYRAGWHHANITDMYEPVRIFVGDIMFTRQADDFLNAIEKGTSSRCTVEAALATQRVLEAMRRAEA